MHKSSYDEMARNVNRYLFSLSDGATVVDIGSLDVNGAYRNLIEPRFKYIGVDIEAGPNVDHVMTSEFNTGLPLHYADAVISGQTLEHCRNPFLLTREIFRIIKPGSFALLTAPWLFQIHRYPLDCWRILPDGMKILIEQSGGSCLAAYIVLTDCWGVGQAA